MARLWLRGSRAGLMKLQGRGEAGAWEVERGIQGKECFHVGCGRAVEWLRSR